MHAIHRFLGPLTILIIALASILGAVGHVQSGVHAIVGLVAVIAVAALQSLLFIYTIGISKSMKAAAAAGSIDATLLADYERLKKSMMGPLHNLCFLGVFVAILGGGADTGHVPGWGHGLVAAWFLWLAIKTCRSHDAALCAMVSVLEEARRRVGREDLLDVLEDVEPRPPADPAQGLDARGRNVLFLAGNVWVAYFYMRYICMSPGVPLWPFAATFVALLGWGIALKLAGRRHRRALAQPIR